MTPAEKLRRAIDPRLPDNTPVNVAVTMGELRQLLEANDAAREALSASSSRCSAQWMGCCCSLA